MKPSSLYIVGITGGIGSGKTSVASVFLEEGIPILNADAIAKQAMTESPRLRTRIRTVFGDASYSPDGSLNTQFISSVAFSDTNTLNKLNELVHPEVRKLATKEFSRLRKNGVRIAGMDAPLIFEAGMEDMFDAILLVVASRQNRIERVLARNPALKKQDIVRRMRYQIDPQKARERADFVITNDETPEELYASSRFILSILRTLAG